MSSLAGSTLLLLLGPGAGPAAAPTVASFLAALKASYEAAGLGVAAGTLFAGGADRGKAIPHVVAKVRDAGSLIETSSGQYDDVRLTLRVRSWSTADARARAVLVNAWMMDGSTTGGADGLGRRFRWVGGGSGPAARVDWVKGQEPSNAPRADGGPPGPVYFDELRYRLAVRGGR